MNIFEALRQSHQQQREVCDQIVQTKGDTPKRRRLHQQLVVLWHAHAQAQERHFYVHLMFDDIGLYMARHALFEHHQIDHCLDEIDGMHYSDSQWLVQMRRVVHLMLLHWAEEEQQVFEQARRILSETQQQQLAQTYAQEYQQAQLSH